MNFDPAKYRHHVDGWDLTEEQKLDLLREVWVMMESFADLAFGMSSEQILLGINQHDGASIRSGEVRSDETPMSEFERAAGEPARKRDS